MLKENTIAPLFSLPSQNGEFINLKDFLGQYVLIYFYPKDDTPGCTTEACTIRDNYEKFKKAKITVLGISADSSESHEKFTQKYNLPFILLSDPKKEVITLYEAKGGLFTKRVSYLISPEGKIVKVYKSVKPNEHAAEILVDKEKLDK